METVDSTTAKHLKQLIEKIERLEEEKKGVSDDIRDIFAEAKSMGFDTKVIRQVLKIRRMNAEERNEMEHLLDVYLHALNMAPAITEADAA
jgi:uncharacterized protein (UPF0335 family)